MEKNNSTHFLNGNTVVAFLFAPFPPLLLMILFMFVPLVLSKGLNGLDELPSMLLYVFLFGLPIVYAIELVLGVPSYYFLKKLGIENVWVTVLFASLFAGGVYLGYEFISLDPPSPDHSTSYGDSGGRIVENNIRTAYGYRVLIKNTVFYMALGAVAGLTFWKTYKAGNAKLTVIDGE